MLDNPRTPTCTFAAMHNDRSSTKLNLDLTAVRSLVVVVVSLERQVQAA
jgi:hypothetical protein